MITFKYMHINLPGKLTPGQIVPIEFPFEGDPSEISQVSPTCGCTAKCEVKDNKVTAIFTNTETRNFTKKINVFTKDKSTIQLSFSCEM